jgi:UDP-galactopyranose mutase
MKFDLLIVGAGIAGLAAADQAVSKGKKVMVIESQNVVGGLCASLTINNCIVDYGVHLLHLRDTQVKEYVMNLVDQNEILKIERGGKLYLFGKYINWPLNLMSVFQMPFKLVIKIAMDQIISFKKRVNIYNEDNYATTTQAIYGRSLYENFFGPLTKKFLKIEQSIRKALKGDVTEFNVEQLTAFKNFSYSDTDESTGNILFLEKDDNKDEYDDIVAETLNHGEDQTNLLFKNLLYCIRIDITIIPSLNTFRSPI